MTMPTVKMLVLLMLQAPTTSAEAPVWRDIGKGICENARYHKISSTLKKDGANSEPLEVCQQRCVESSKCLSIYHVVIQATNYTLCTLYSKAYTKAEKPRGAPITLGEFEDGQPIDHRCWTRAPERKWRDNGKGVCENARMYDPKVMISKWTDKDDNKVGPLPLAFCQQRCVANPSCLSIYREVHPINNEVTCILYKKAYTKAEDTGGFIGGKLVPKRCWTLASRTTTTTTTTAMMVPAWRDNGKGSCEGAKAWDKSVTGPAISYTQFKKDESLAVCQQRCVETPSCLSIYRSVHPINNEATCILYKKAYTKALDNSGTIGGKPVQDRCWTLAWVRLQDTGCFAWTKLGETYPESKTKGWMAKENKPVAATVLESWKKVDFLEQALRMKLVKNTGCPIEGQITSRASFFQTLWVAFIAVSCAVMQ